MRNLAQGLRRALGVCALIVLAGCGGGGGVVASGGVGGTGGGAGGGAGGNGGVGGTGVVALGAISGFGSVVVNGTHFDVTAQTQIKIDDEDTASAEDLELGMVVEIVAYQDTNTGVTKAQSITYQGNVTGPIGAIDSGCRSMTVLSQTVQIDAQTQPPLVNGVCDFAAGEVVEVSGLVSNASANSIRATLIRRKSAGAPLKLSGELSSLDAAQQTFEIGSLTVLYAGASIEPAGVVLAPGMQAEVSGSLTAPDRLAATSVKVVPMSSVPRAGTEAEIQGFLENLNGRTFTVNGQVIDATSASIEPINAQFAVGLKVEVEGKFDDRGVVVAKKVSVEADD